MNLTDDKFIAMTMDLLVSCCKHSKLIEGDDDKGWCFTDRGKAIYQKMCDMASISDVMEILATYLQTLDDAKKFQDFLPKRRVEVDGLVQCLMLH